MLNKIPWFLLVILLLMSGCNFTKKIDTTPVLLKVEDATQEQLLNEINRFAKVNSMKAKMDLKFEDTSFAQKGSKQSYISVNGDVVVQRPANILLKVEFLTVDIAQMSSNGEKFRVAILNDNSGGKFKKFVIGTNNADYTNLQKGLEDNSSDDAKSVSSFSNLRPQHFTDALLIRPTDSTRIYLRSTIFQIEEDETQKKNSPLRKVTRGYYLLDELRKEANGALKVDRRFWFDRVGGIRLARQQLFDLTGEIESDIIYGREGNLSNTGEYNNLPLRVEVTRPKEKYTMSLTYQSPANVTIGKTYPATVFVLQNTWGLDEVDLDKNFQESKKAQAKFNN